MAAAGSGLAARMDDVATCPICLEDFNDPRLLLCLHSFCLRCLKCYCKDKSPGDNASCPLCRKTIHIPQDGIEGLQRNFFLQNLVDAKNADGAKGKFTCEACSTDGRGKAATVYCVDCRQKLCDRCSVAHKNWKGGSHDVRAMDNELSTELIWLRGGYCFKHADKRLELYCFDCKENICMKCFAVSHQQHQCEETEKVAKDIAESIQSDIRPFPSRISKTRELIEQLKTANEEFLEKVKKMQDEVQKKGSEIKLLVDDHVTKLVQELDEVKANSAKEVVASLESFELAITALDTFQTYSSQLTAKGSACDITRAANDLHARAEELLKTPPPSGDFRPPNIQFVPANVDNFGSETSNIIGFLLRSDNTASQHPPNLPPRRAELAKAGTQEIGRNLNEVRRESAESTSSKIPPSVPQRTVELAHAAKRQIRKRNSDVVRQEYLELSLITSEPFPKVKDVRGVTLLNNQVYVLTGRTDDQVDVFSSTEFVLLRRFGVKGLSSDLQDIASCAQKQRIYMSDSYKSCIHRVGLDKSVSRWSVKGDPRGLAVTRSSNLLVTTRDILGENGKLVELSSEDGSLVREIALSLGAKWPRHGVELSNDQYLVCYGLQNSRINVIGVDGVPVRSNSGDGGLDRPYHMAVGPDGFIFVADSSNKRIVLFDPSLKFVRSIFNKTHCSPRRLCFDAATRRLFVGHDGKDITVVQL